MANEVVFLLRFDTALGEAEVRRSSSRIQSQLQKALKIPSIRPQDINVSMGLDRAVSGVTRLDAELRKVQNTLRSLNAQQLETVRHGLDPMRIAGIKQDKNFRFQGMNEKGKYVYISEDEAHKRIAAAEKGIQPVSEALSRATFREAITPLGKKGRKFTGSDEEIALNEELAAQLAVAREKTRADRTAFNLAKGRMKLEALSLQERVAVSKLSVVKEAHKRDPLTTTSADVNAARAALKAARDIAQADKERLEARKLEARAIRESALIHSRAIRGTARQNEKAIADAEALLGSQKRGGFAHVYGMSEDLRERVRKEREAAGKAFANEKKAGRTVEGETLEDFMPGVRRTKYDAERRRVTDERRNSAEIIREEKAAAKSRVAKEAFDKIAEPERLHAKRYRTEKAKEFAATGRGAPTGLGALFGERTKTFEEFLGHSRKKGARNTPENTLGISKTATNLLALSSVLTPLNSQLGAVVMQAGFAAFSLGAPLAALSLLSAAVAGFAGVLKKSAVTAKEAGLETIGFSKATIGLNSEVRMFLNILGVKTQNAFEPVVKELTAMFQELEGLPWEGLVKGAADFTLGLIELSKWLMFIGKYTVLPQGLGKRVPERDKEVNGKKLLAHEGGPRDLRRLLGLEPSVFYTEDKSKEDKFRYTPKFDFASIDTLGRDIQRSIFRAESQDPAVRALQAIDVTTRELLQEAKKPETIKESADIIRERTSRMGF